MKNIFIFDLDSTVVEPLSFGKEIIFQEIDNDLGINFRQALSLEACGYTHMVFPGFYSLFRWIHDRGDLIYFFSTGIEERNLELVPKLIKKSFGNKAEEVLANVKVFSRQHCINTELMSGEDGKKYQPDGFYGQRKKKLEGLVVTKQELPWSLLIDDDPSYKVKGEEENYLYVPSYIYYYSSYQNDDAFRSFHKAYYIRGILEKILELVKEKSISLANAASIINKKLDKAEFKTKCEIMLPYYEEGLQLLREINPELQFYFVTKQS